MAKRKKDRSLFYVWLGIILLIGSAILVFMITGKPITPPAWIFLLLGFLALFYRFVKYFGSIFLDKGRK